MIEANLRENKMGEIATYLYAEKNNPVGGLLMIQEGRMQCSRVSERLGSGAQVEGLAQTRTQLGHTQLGGHGEVVGV